MELLESRVEGVEELIASVHDVAAKQLDLISEVIQEQNKLKKLHIRSVDSAVNDDDKASSSQTVDEWGRRRVQRLENRDGTVSFSFDSS
jgi:3-hydroxyacyl-CoA dehydrogenase